MKQVAVITGTSTGLGLKLAVLLAQRGYTTIATMRDTAKKAALLAEAEQAGVELAVRALDVQNAESVEACIQSIGTEFGPIDVLVNNAGAGYVRTTEQATEEEIADVLDVNLMGVIRCTRAVLPSMRERRRGHIVNISSVGGLVGQPFNEIYCAAKFAVEGYTESLATYVQPTFGINFTLVEPGGISTEFVNNVMKKVNDTGGILEDAYSPVLARYMGGVQKRAAEGKTATYQTAQQVAEVVANCIGLENPPLRLRTSEWGEKFCHFKVAGDPDGTKQRDMVVEMFLE